jgi:acid stress chaperone HdeB
MGPLAENCAAADCPCDRPTTICRASAIPRHLTGTIMKTLIVLTAAAFLSASIPAQAQRLDVSTVKCKEFLGSSTENIAFIMMWMQGYYSADDSSPVIDFDKMKNDGIKIAEYCAKNPDDSLITAADETIAE